MSKRSAPAARAGASKRHNKVRKQELVEIEYDNEWYLGEVTKEIADGGARVYFLVDKSTVVIPRKERDARIRKPSSAAVARFEKERRATAEALVEEEAEKKKATAAAACRASLDVEWADALVPKLAKAFSSQDVAPPSAFAFFIISKGRTDNVADMEALFEGTGASPTWLVGTGEVPQYRAALAAYCQAKSPRSFPASASAAADRVLEGGKLTPSRNKAMELAKAEGKLCVQLSDDLSSFTLFEGKAKEEGKPAGGGAGGGQAVAWRKPSSQQEANQRSYRAAQHGLSPVGAARMVEVGMRQVGAKYGGVFPCMNAGFAFNNAPITVQHFIVGDFIVLDPGSPLRFDEELRLKEDYDLTAQHLDR